MTQAANRVQAKTDPEPVSPEDRLASAAELLALADVYQLAAWQLRGQIGLLKRRSNVSWSPFHLCAIQAIELYLSAFLVDTGRCDGKALKTLLHDLAERARQAEDAGLRLDKNTRTHLAEMTERNEYRVVRYDSGAMQDSSEINRLERSLEEVAEQVRARMSVQASARGGGI